MLKSSFVSSVAITLIYQNYDKSLIFCCKIDILDIGSGNASRFEMTDVMFHVNAGLGLWPNRA